MQRVVIVLIGGILFSLCFAEFARAQETAFPLKVSDNRRYLVDQNGRPFFVLGDMPWYVQKLPIEDIRRILDDRKTKGFNTLFMAMVDEPIGAKDVNGNLPFENQTDITHPVEAYWKYVDQMLEETGKRGFLIILSSLWHGAGEGSWSFHLTPEKARTYGDFLGRRYARFNNILWVHCGDHFPDANLVECTRQMASAIKAAAPHHLHTAHLEREYASAAVFTDDAWLDVNMGYTAIPAYLHVIPEYRRRPVRPVILGEQGMEGEDYGWYIVADKGGSPTTWTPYPIRRNSWWAAMTGACGACMGTRLWRYEPNWREILDVQSAREAPVLLKVLQSRPWWKLVPDISHKFLVFGASGYGWEVAYPAEAAVAEDGSLGVVYTPGPRKMGIDFSKLRGPVRATWYDPTNGDASEAKGSPFTASGRQYLNTPDHPNAGGQADWVLVLEPAAAQ